MTDKVYVTATYKGEHVNVSDYGVGGLLHLGFTPMPVSRPEAEGLYARAMRDESLTDQQISDTILY